MRLLDTNVFLRAIVQPEDAVGEARSRAASALFGRLAEGDEEATTIEAVVAEVCYVLRSKAQYGLTPEDIALRLRPILLLRGLRLDHKQVYLRALELWPAFPALDFEDALLVAHAERMGMLRITSYDTDFDRIPGIEREEP